MLEDLEPPSFDFGPREPEPDEPLEPEIVVTRVGDEEEPRPKRRFPFVPKMSETTARVVVAIPWAIFAIVIVGVGGDSSWPR